jgi:hypothetical protein
MTLASAIRAQTAALAQSAIAGWNRFWFAPSDAATLAVIRILAGAMLLYTHAVWTIDLLAFFGPQSWVTVEAAQFFHRGSGMMTGELYGGDSFAWSIFFWARTPAAVWAVHLAGLVVFACLTLGFLTRIMAILAWVLAVSYVQRTPGALFGLDQINTMLAMYLMVGPSGASYSLDAWLRRRRTAALPDTAPLDTSATVATRLIQLHMCVIYMFAGIGKLVGPAWWMGTGIWGGVSNYEYQSLDATWLAWWPMLSATMSHVTVYWEIYYPVLIWPKKTRPIMLLIAIPLHLGIALFMGMITFGVIMLVANLAFIPPAAMRRAVNWLLARRRTKCVAQVAGDRAAIIEPRPRTAKQSIQRFTAPRPSH